MVGWSVRVLEVLSSRVWIGPKKDRSVINFEHDPINSTSQSILIPINGRCR